MTPCSFSSFKAGAQIRIQLQRTWVCIDRERGVFMSSLPVPRSVTLYTIHCECLKENLCLCILGGF